VRDWLVRCKVALQTNKGQLVLKVTMLPARASDIDAARFQLPFWHPALEIFLAMAAQLAWVMVKRISYSIMHDASLAHCVCPHCLGRAPSWSVVMFSASEAGRSRRT
jgi:hypothetical protein